MTRLAMASRRLRIGAALIVALCAARPATAGHTITAFAEIEPGPRLMAMGGAGAGLVDDPTAAWWNPAGLYFMQGTRAVITYDDLYGAGLAQRSYLAVAWKKVHYKPSFNDNRMTLDKDLGRGSAWGLSVSSVFLDLGEESYTELIPSLSFAAGLGGGIGLGTSISFLKASSGLEAVGASGYAATFGIGVKLPGNGRLGYAARNLLSHVSPEGGAGEKLGVTSAVGLSWPIGPHGRIAGEATFADDDDGVSRVSAGGEYWFLEHHLAGRAGVRRYDGGVDSRIVPTFGLGIEWSRVGFDYAFMADGDAGPGSTHRFGLHVLLGRPQ